VRYLFRGVIRATGRIVEGHVEGADEEEAFGALADNGIVTETLAPDPKPLNLSEELPAAPEFADALDSAFDSSSSQVSFDDLTERYRGKKVWVIDRDKIRRRVAQVVDAALALSHSQAEGAAATRERIASALLGLFSDNRNLASERNASSIAGMKVVGTEPQRPLAAPTPRPAPPAPPVAPPLPAAAKPSMAGGNGKNASLEEQIARLAGFVKQAEGVLAAISAAARRVGSGDGPRRMVSRAHGASEPQNEVLLEIFKSNLELIRQIEANPDGLIATAEAEGEPPAS